MLHKNVIEEKSGFRTLSETELEFVSGGTITVTASNFASLTPEDLALVGETLGTNAIVVTGTLGEESDSFDDEDGFQTVGWPILPTFQGLQDALRTIVEEIARQLGFEPIDPEDQATLNQELNSKEQAFTTETDDGIRVTFTRDGTAYYDRNGDGAVDIKTRVTPFGTEYDTGDGTGWRLL